METPLYSISLHHTPLNTTIHQIVTILGKSQRAARARFPEREIGGTTDLESGAARRRYLSKQEELAHVNRVRELHQSRSHVVTIDPESCECVVL